MSLMLELTAYKGIALQAVFGTMAITATMYVMYASRIIRPTPAFNKVIGGLVMSIMLLYLTSFVLGMFTPYDVPFLHTSGPIGIGLTAFILVVAALTLISDFGFIESGSFDMGHRRTWNGTQPSASLCRWFGFTLRPFASSQN